MGRSTTATAAMAVTIKICDLYADVGHVRAFELLTDPDVVVMDENSWSNEHLDLVIEQMRDKFPDDSKEFAVQLQRKCRIEYGRNGCGKLVDTEDESLFDSAVVALHKVNLGECERWGYRRVGINVTMHELPDIPAITQELQLWAQEEGLVQHSVSLLTLLHAA